MTKVIMMGGSVRAMVLTMIHQAELEKDQPHGIWKSQNMNLLTLTQLKLDR